MPGQLNTTKALFIFTTMTNERYQIVLIKNTVFFTVIFFEFIHLQKRCIHLEYTTGLYLFSRNNLKIHLTLSHLIIVYQIIMNTMYLRVAKLFE